MTAKGHNSTSKRYMHFSIDDVNDILKEITANAETLPSIFEEPRLAVLQEFHNSFGACFSLYLFLKGNSGWNLTYMTNKFKEEFSKNSSWLKLGFHAYDSSTNYGNGTINPANARIHWDHILSQIIRFAGIESVDTIPRTHFFSGTKDIIQEWKKSAVPPQGFLCADDSRTSNLYLDETQRAMLDYVPSFYDRKEKLYMLKSMPRMDSGHILSTLNHKTHYNQLIQFLHEPNIRSRKADIAITLQWAAENGYEFAFPMNHIPERTW